MATNTVSRGLLLDHLVGGCKQRLGDAQAERLGGREVDNQLELGRLPSKNRKGALVFARAKTSSQGQNCSLTDRRRDPQTGTFGMICRHRSTFNAARSADVMRYLATILTVLVTAPSWANERVSILQQAEALGAPVAAVRRAIEISHQPTFEKKDVLAVFDISKPSKKKRFYVVDFKLGQVTAHYAAHGKHNGPAAQATKFKGFQTDLDMVPLGPLKTAHAIELDPYKTIVDRYDGTIYRNMIVVVLEGVTSYNSYINDNPPFKWVIHPNWYATAAFRAKNNGGLGRSDGCIVLDPAENNELITRFRMAPWFT